MEKENITMLIEAAQDITLCAWSQVYGSTPAFSDSRIVLQLFRDWAKEFEAWWQSDAVKPEEDDYMLAVERFTEKKIAELGIPEKKKEFFPVTSISRDDLEAAGFDAAGVTDEQMERLADKMADDYLEQMYWVSMKILAEDALGIPKKKVTHTISAKSGPVKVTVFIAATPEEIYLQGYWWAIKGTHTVFYSEGKPFKSGTQVNNVETVDCFNYYGDSTDERPDNVADMDTLLWLIRDK